MNAWRQLRVGSGMHGPELAFADAEFLDEVRASRQLTRSLGQPLLTL